MRKQVAAALTAVATAAMGVGFVAPAHADLSQDHVVSENPMDATPNVRDGTVRDFAIVGNKVVVAGTFTTVRNHGNATNYTHRGIFAFNRTTGKLDQAFDPKVNGNVNALAAGSDGTVYAGGTFTTVNGAAQRGVVQLKVSDGSTVAAFSKSRLNGGVFALDRSGSQLYVGGLFTKATSAAHAGVARLNATTGKADANFDIQVSEPWRGALRVGEIAVDPLGSRLVMTGSFRQVNGESRPQAAVIDTSGDKAKLADWRAGGFNKKCQAKVDYYARDVDFSPDGNYFDIVSTGGHAVSGSDKDTICDSATRWKADATGNDVQPVWVNHTGGDSLYSVADTGAAVYVGGHERWLDNPNGHDSKGPGAVDRPGIGAISPSSGKALSWNPTKDRGHGAEALVASSDGLYVGSDTDHIGGEWHQKVGFLPLPDTDEGGSVPAGGGDGKKVDDDSGKQQPAPGHPGHKVTKPAHHGKSHHGKSHHRRHLTMPSDQSANSPVVRHENPSALPAGVPDSMHGMGPAVRSMNRSDELPFTGAPIALSAAVALALILGGGGFMYYSRRTRKSAEEPLD